MSSELANPGDPLVGINGEIVGESSYEDMEVPLPSTPVPFKFYRPTHRRVVSDLRATDQAINVASVIFVYTVLGISDAEICKATGLSAQEVNKVRELRVYSDIFENIMHELINANSEYLEARIAAYAPMALGNVAHIAKCAENEAVKLSASKDILDRSGHRPQDQAGRASSGLNELHIVITSAKDAPDVEMKFNLNSRNEEDHADS